MPKSSLNCRLINLARGLITRAVEVNYHAHKTDDLAQCRRGLSARHGWRLGWLLADADGVDGGSVRRHRDRRGPRRAHGGGAHRPGRPQDASRRAQRVGGWRGVDLQIRRSGGRSLSPRNQRSSRSNRSQARHPCAHWRPGRRRMGADGADLRSSGRTGGPTIYPAGQFSSGPHCLGRALPVCQAGRYGSAW